MRKMNVQKYKPYPVVELPDRQWPSQVIDTPPQWCSVDLRDGNQALINPMTIDQKLEMFQLLVDIGFKEIEIGFPSASQVELEFLRLLIEDNLIPDDVTIQVLTQAREHLIHKTFESLEGTKNAIVHVYNSTSTLQRDVVFGMDRKEIINIAIKGAELLQDLAPQLKDTNVRFQYSPESFTGTEMDYALEICEAVVDVWQPTPEKQVIINLPATVEMATPNVYADQIEWFLTNVKNRESIILSLHPHNDRGTAVAAAELGVMAGADRVEGTLFGNGERTGNVDIFTMALNMFSQGVDPNLDLTDVNQIIAVSERCTQIPIHVRHPYAGKLVYTAFSGSHQDAINKGMAAYEKRQSPQWEVPYLPIDPRDVGRNYEAIIRINSQSGKGGIAYVMERKFGYKLPKSMHPEFGQVVQNYSDKVQREVQPNEIYQCFEEEYLKKEVPFALKHCDVSSIPHETEDDVVKTSVHVKLSVNGNEIEVTGEGNGPIDAFSHAIRDARISSYRLISYEEHALDTGTNAKAVSYIQIETQQHTRYFGVGIDSDISVASIKAIVCAMNRAYADQVNILKVPQPQDVQNIPEIA